MEFENQVITEAVLRRKVSFILILFIICTIIMSNQLFEIHSFYNTNILEKYISEERWLKELNIQSPCIEFVKTIDDIWAYTFYNYLRLMQIFFYDYRNMSDVDNKFLYMGFIIGRPRIRQLRVKPVKCIHNMDISFTCYPEYAFQEEEKGYYRGIKYHEDASKLYTDSHTYDGGGFSIDFIKDPTKNNQQFLDLYYSDWIDRATRLVVFEMILHHISTKEFTFLKILFEIYPTGFVEPSVQIRTMPIKPFLISSTFRIVICTLFYVIIFYHTGEKIYDIWMVGIKKLSKEFIFYVDIIVLVCSYGIMIYTIVHLFLLRGILETVEKNNDRYVNMDALLTNWKATVILMAIMVYMVWFKFLHIFSLHRSLKRLLLAIKLSANNAIAFVCLYLIVVLGFAMMGTVLFSEKSNNFKTVFSSMFFLIRLVMYDVEIMPLLAAEPVLGTIYYVAIVVILYAIPLNLFVSIYLATYTKVRKYLKKSDEKNFKMICAVLKNIICFWRKRHITDEHVTVFEPTLQAVPMKHHNPKLPRTELIVQLREDLARLTERSYEIELSMEKLVVTIDDAKKLQKLKKN